MKPFLGPDFFLESQTASRLYHEFAADCPIYDYHCHLPIEQIHENKVFTNLTEIWLDGDHYKWRAMRANGVDEQLISGDADPYDRFRAWVETVPYTLRNPLYLWSHLELRRYFDIDVIIEPRNADLIWRNANEKLAGLSVSEIFRRFKVAAVCTTDDPADSLDHHKEIAIQNPKTRVYPAFRPDRAFAIDSPEVFNEWLGRLQKLTGPIDSFEALLAALKSRHEDFHQIGCRLSDHGLEFIAGSPMNDSEAEAAFQRTKSGAPATSKARADWTFRLLTEFARWDAEKGWTKQLHLGPIRNTNPAGLARLGADAGYDSIGDFRQAEGLRDFLGAMDKEGHLPLTILYNVNPSDNYVFATMAGNFMGEGRWGKVQFGSGWWYLDQKEGIELQLNTLSNAGLLRRFVGMLTDSRSFLSYPRHEYFRRVLCNLLGRDMEQGLLPNDLDLVGKMVREICFLNARDYFGLELEPTYKDFA